LKQYGERKAADEVSAEWQGGAYATFRRKDKTVSDVVPTTADLSLLYVSRWKTPQVADWFARFYVRSLSQRYHSATVQPSVACSEANCQASSTLVVTEEGPVIVELWKDNSVIVSESFDPAMAAKLRTALRDGASATHAQNLPQEEIGFRLLQSPTFQSFERQVGEQIKNQMWQAHMWQESQR
jgi:hypothetical protein